MVRRAAGDATGEATNEVAALVEQAKNGTVPVWLVAVLLFAPGSIAGLVGGVGTKLAISSASTTVSADVAAVVTATVSAATDSINAKTQGMSQEIKHNAERFDTFAAKCRQDKAAMTQAMEDLADKFQSLDSKVKAHLKQQPPQPPQSPQDSSQGQAPNDRGHA